ncbi:MAG: hypothetical protein ACOCWQ_00200 [Nanoarchaeota archaeon]
MVFSKRFPYTENDSNYTRWEEVDLSSDEESRVSSQCRQENIDLMSQCIDDAREIILKQGMKVFDANIIQIALGLFEKRASHEVYFKEACAKQKFDQKRSER